MININLLRENPDLIKEGMKKKLTDPNLVDRFLVLDEEWKTLRRKTDDLRASQKNLGPENRDKAKEIKEEVIQNEDRIKILEAEKDSILNLIPNMPFAEVPVGKDDEENQTVRIWGEAPKFAFEPKDYMAVAKNLIDTERASKISGSRFGYIFGDLAELEFALIRFAMDLLTPHGFRVALPPVLIRPDTLRKTGKGKFIDGGDAFYLPADDLYLVGSSEQSLVPMFMDETIDITNPKRFLGFSTCFRREAGSYGKDTKGILRVHQFNKLEMISFCHPDKSEEEHQFLLARQEEIMQKLGIHHRVIINCTGDMGFDGGKQYDVEAWIPSQNKFRETHSCTNTTDFQARGLQTTFRMKTEDGKEKNEFVHTLNATALSERPLLAILENYQQEDGTVLVPEVLRPYFGRDIINPNK